MCGNTFWGRGAHNKLIVARDDTHNELPIIRDALPDQIVCFFEHCSNGLWPPPPPSFLNIYVADFSKGLLKKCVNACRDKRAKIVRKSLGENVRFTKKLWQFYLQFVTILPQEDLFYVNLYCRIASRIIPNLQQNFWTWVWPPPPVWTMFKKTDDLVRQGVPKWIGLDWIGWDHWTTARLDHRSESGANNLDDNYQRK